LTPTRPQTFHPRLSVIIPAYNEEKRLEPTLDKVCGYLKKWRHKSEIIVVDDASTDGTLALANRWKKKHPGLLRVVTYPVNQGKGGAVRAGVFAARGDVLLFSDADLSTPIEETDKLWKVVTGGADMAAGSRALKDSNIVVPQPALRKLSGWVFRTLTHLITVSVVRDTQCGFKMFSHELGKRVMKAQRVARFGFDVEMIFLAVKYGYRVVEVPVTWADSPNSTVNPLKDGARMFGNLLEIRWNDLRGRYNEFKRP
jgi:dolichyl-phosphate beta-glucosyltransferase